MKTIRPEEINRTIMELLHYEYTGFATRRPMYRKNGELFEYVEEIDFLQDPRGTLMLLCHMERFELYGTKTQFHCRSYRRGFVSADTIQEAVVRAFLGAYGIKI